MKLLVQIAARNRVLALTVEPSDTIGAALSQLLRIENMMQRPDGQQRLMLGGTLLDNDRTLADACIEHEATLEFVDPCLPLGIALPQAAASLLDSLDTGVRVLAAADAAVLSSQSSGVTVAVARAHEGHGSGASAAAAVDAAPLLPSHSSEQALLLAVAPVPPLPPPTFRVMWQLYAPFIFLRRARSTQADVIICRLLGHVPFEIEQIEGEWALVSPSEYERLKATGEAFVAHDANAGGWCRFINPINGSIFWASLNVDDMSAAVAAHRSLLALCASSSSWVSPSIVPALQSLIDSSDSPSAQAYACSAACTWCKAGVVAAAADAVPLIQSIARLRSSASRCAKRHALAAAWALALEFVSPNDAAAKSSRTTYTQRCC